MRRDRIVVISEALTSFGKERQEDSRVEKESVCSFRQRALLSNCVNAEGCVRVELGHRESVQSRVSVARDLAGVNCDF